MYLSNSKGWIVGLPRGVIDETGHQLLNLVNIFGPGVLQTENKFTVHFRIKYCFSTLILIRNVELQISILERLTANTCSIGEHKILHSNTFKNCADPVGKTVFENSWIIYKEDIGLTFCRYKRKF